MEVLEAVVKQYRVVRKGRRKDDNSWSRIILTAPIASTTLAKLGPRRVRGAQGPKQVRQDLRRETFAAANPSHSEQILLGTSAPRRHDLFCVRLPLHAEISYR